MKADSRGLEFLYLRNEGSPTMWGGTEYFEYLKSISGKLPSDLIDMTSRERFNLGTRGTFWHAQLVSYSFSHGSIALTFQSDSSELLFDFLYTGVVKVVNEFRTQYCLPSLVVQELVPLKGRLYRHVLSGLSGDKFAVYAKHINFTQSERH